MEPAVSALVGMAECAVWRTVAQMMRSRRKRIIAMDGLEAADSMVPIPLIDIVTVLAESSCRTDRLHSVQAAPDPSLECLDIDTAKTRLKSVALEDDAAAAAEARWHKIQELIDGHVRAGRILPCERSRLAALLATLPDDEASAIVYAAADGSNNELSETPAAILESFLAVLPRRTDYAVPGARRTPKRVDDENRAVAVAARALMVKQAGEGVIPSADHAIEQVKGKHDPPTGAPKRR